MTTIEYKNIVGEDYIV
ncbi:hypothetical protein MT403_07585 [Clostridioides difficile]|nr:hypothetical protein [Clostridioides difficile]MCJ1755377.1 hypothetical protein [Clostridioides difficile]